MEKEFVPYEQSLELKDLGFDEPCFIYWVYDGVEITYSTSHNKSGWSIIGFKNSQMLKKAGLCTAPTFSQAFRWFREKYNYDVSIKKRKFEIEKLEIYEESDPDYYFTDFPFDSYEESQLKCLKKLIEIVKQK